MARTLLFRSKATNESVVEVYACSFYDDGTYTVDMYGPGGPSNPTYRWKAEGGVLYVWSPSSFSYMSKASSQQQEAYTAWLRSSILRSIAGDEACG